MSDARVPVSSAVYDALRADILGARLAPGEGIPSERVLSERFGCNRHAVREAVKRLQQAGLVQVSHGGATRVRDWRRSGGLELLVDLPGAGAAGAVSAGYELRACLAAEVAARGAARIDDSGRDALRERAALLAAVRAGNPAPAMNADHDGAAAIAAVAARSDADTAHDLALLLAYRELWDVIVDASDNIAYRLAYNSLLTGEDDLVALAVTFLRDELHDAPTCDALVAAVLDGDTDEARAAATTLAARTLRALALTEVPA